MVNTNEQNLLSVEQVAKLLQMNKETVRRLVKDGKLTAYDLPNGYHFEPGWINAFLTNRIVNPELAKEERHAN